jgi:hypothetical protein
MSPLRIWRLDDKFPRKTGPGSVVLYAFLNAENVPLVQTEEIAT